MATPKELTEKAAKEFYEKTGVELKPPMVRKIVTFITNRSADRKVVEKWGAMFDDKEKLEVFTRWVEELSKTQKIPPIPDLLQKSTVPLVSDTLEKAPAEESKPTFSMGAKAFVPNVFATSTTVFNATAPSFSPSRAPEVPMCEEGLYCTDILCPKRHPPTRFTSMKAPAV